MAKTYNDYLQEILNAQKEDKEKEQSKVDEKYQAKTDEITNEYSANAQELNEIYNDYIDKSYVQKLIDKKQVQETLANLGLTDSGLSRTQQTAVQLSHANRVGKYNLSKQKQIDALAKEMRGKVSDALVQAEKEKTDIEKSYQKTAETKATELLKNQEAGESAKAKAWKNVVNTLFDSSTSVKERNFVLEEYYLNYGLDDNEKLLLDKMLIDYRSFGKPAQQQKEDQIENLKLSDQRIAELKKLCSDNMVTKQHFNSERKLGNVKGTYSQYVRKILDQWRFDLRITQAEYEYLLYYYRLER